MFFTKQLPSFDFSFYDLTIDVNHLTNRLEIAVRLYSDRSKITSKSVKNKEVAKSQTLLLVSSSCFFFLYLTCNQFLRKVFFSNCQELFLSPFFHFSSL